MKKLVSFLVLVMLLSVNSHKIIAQVMSFSTENTSAFSLHLDGWVGDGGTYGVGVGIGSSAGIANFPCGFTVLYQLGTSASDIKLSGKVHYSYSSTYTGVVNSPFQYFFPTDTGSPFLVLNEIPAGSRPTGLSYIRIVIAPDYGAPAVALFRNAMGNIDIVPFVNRLLNSGDIRGNGPISSTASYYWVKDIYVVPSL